MNNRTLVFTIALNGYQILYKNHINTQKEYARRYGYQYVAVQRPLVTSLGRECAWLKVSLMLEALNAGFETVMFVDADALIQTETPPLGALMETGKSIYMAKGYSDRFNTGVIILQNTNESKKWLMKILSICESPLDQQDYVGWGENGHIITASKDNKFIKTLNKKWNNNSDIHLDDFIRHFSAGPIRTSSNIIERIYYDTFRLLRRVNSVISSKDKNINLGKALNQLTNATVKYYPVFSTQQSQFI